MKSAISVLYRKALKRLLTLFYVFPIRRNRIIFCSYDTGVGYTCNPKYICEYLKKKDPGHYDLVWAFSDPEKWSRIRGIRGVRIHSVRWLYEMLTARVVVYNRIPESYLPKRPGQLVINTWHAGGAYKKVGFEKGELGELDLWRARQMNEYVDLFLTSSEAFTKSNIDGYRYTGEVMKSGMPRNDLFFRPSVVRKVRSRVRESLGTGEEDLVVLYAPTFRRNVLDPKARSVTFPYQAAREALAARFGTDAVRIWKREHHAYGLQDGEDEEALDVSQYPDMQELLCAANILVTDYSSSIWDFSLRKKPCFLYVPDLDDYVGEDRGFFTPIEEWPGIICRDEEALLNAFRHLDEEASAAKAEAALRAMVSYEDGHAAERVCRRIRETVFGKESAV